MANSRKSIEERIEILNEALESLVREFLEEAIPNAHKAILQANNDVNAGISYIANHMEYLETSMLSRFWHLRFNFRPYHLCGNLLHFLVVRDDLNSALEKLKQHKQAHVKAIEFCDNEMDTYSERYKKLINRVDTILTHLVNYINYSSRTSKKDEMKIFPIKTKSSVAPEKYKNNDGFYCFRYNVFSLDERLIYDNELAEMVGDKLCNSIDLNLHTLIGDYKTEAVKKYNELILRMTEQRHYHYSRIESIKKQETEDQQTLVISEVQQDKSTDLLKFKENKLEQTLSSVSFLNEKLAKIEANSLPNLRK